MKIRWNINQINIFNFRILSLLSLEISQNYFRHHEGNRAQFVSMFGPGGAKDPNQSSTSIPPENERKPLFYCYVERKLLFSGGIAMKHWREMD